jgi:hypothetical protein
MLEGRIDEHCAFQRHPDRWRTADDDSAMHFLIKFLALAPVKLSASTAKPGRDANGTTIDRFRLSAIRPQFKMPSLDTFVTQRPTSRD